MLTNVSEDHGRLVVRGPGKDTFTKIVRYAGRKVVRAVEIKEGDSKTVNLNTMETKKVQAQNL